jgi:hypothetical protein
MIKKLSALAAVALASMLLVGQTVTAQDLDFGFEVNSVESSTGKRIFTYDVATFTLGVTANSTVDLTVNGLTFFNADFDFSATTTAGSTEQQTVGTQNFLLTPFDGEFSFFEAGSGDLLLRVVFNDAILSVRDGARNGALFQSDDGITLMELGADVSGLASTPPRGFSFALGSANPTFNDGNTEGDGDLQSFTAKSSFLADTSVIPEPSGFILTAFGMLGFAALRRRQK